MFQSPLGEVVKETGPIGLSGTYNDNPKVSIPSRGSGKGDLLQFFLKTLPMQLFQSPLGEVVKETGYSVHNTDGEAHVSIPSRGSGKGDSSAREPYPERVSSLKSTHHFLPVNKTVKPAISSVACKP